MAVKGTPTYVWFTAQHLGRGAMGNVFVARDRKKGTKFAAKIFTPESKMMTKDYIASELDILQHLPRHENVIKFVATEQETYSKDRVIIMELCEGGSLQNILDDPENFYGMDEDEFLVTFEQISSALNHLFLNHIVHRDIKPGNILLQITEENRHTYKLIDFGAARRLDQDDEGFKSLCGTEEYLHPMMHQAAFIRRVPGQRYDHTVDLWSWGVTVYQCATGSLPFVPKAGIRQDKHMMQKLINEKNPDVISQTEKMDGSIESRRDLPDTCSLTSGTSAYVTSFLRDLLNVRDPVQPSTFFSNVQKFYGNRKFFVFSLEMRTMLSVYVAPTQTLVHLQEAIAQQTSIPANAQILLLADELLTDHVTSVQRIDSYPPTTMTEPLFLTVTKEYSSDCKDFKPYLPKLPDYTIGLDVSSDSKWAKEVLGQVWYYRRLIDMVVLMQNHMMATQRALWFALKNMCRKIEQFLWKQGDCQTNLESMVKGLSDRIETLHQTDCQCQSNQRITDIKNAVDHCQSRFRGIQTQYYNGTCSRIERWQTFGNKYISVACVENGKCKARASKLVADAVPMYKSLRDDKHKELTHNDIEIHKFTRSELKRSCRRIRDRVENHCMKETLKQYHQAVAVILEMKDCKRQLMGLEESVATFEGRQKSVYEDLAKCYSIGASPKCRYHGLGVTVPQDNMPKTTEELCLRSSVEDVAPLTEKYMSNVQLISQDLSPKKNIDDVDGLESGRGASGVMYCSDSSEDMGSSKIVFSSGSTHPYNLTGHVNHAFYTSDSSYSVPSHDEGEDAPLIHKTHEMNNSLDVRPKIPKYEQRLYNGHVKEEEHRKTNHRKKDITPVDAELLKAARKMSISNRQQLLENNRILESCANKLG